MTVQQQSGTPWLKACGIGCLVLVVLGILGGIGLYYVVGSALDKGADAMAEVILETYDEAKAGGAVPTEHTALFDEIVAASQSEDATMWTNVLAAGAVVSAFEDEQVTDEEIAAAEEVRDFLREHPSVSLSDFAGFLDEHPELAETMQDMQGELQSR